MIRRTTLRIVTWNLWQRFGPWPARQRAIERTLADLAPDIVALQEVWVEPGQADQAALLGRALGMDHTFTPCARVDGLDIGNSILSRWPIVGTDQLELPGSPSVDARRCYVTRADVAGPRGSVATYTTHLAHEYHASALRQCQARQIARFVAGRADGDFPPILAGDFNADPACDEIRILTGRTTVAVPGLVFHDAWDLAGRGSGHTWSNRNSHARSSLAPSRRIDYVLVGVTGRDGIGHVVRAGLAGTVPIENVIPSDHYAVVADLRY